MSLGRLLRSFAKSFAREEEEEEEEEEESACGVEEPDGSPDTDISIAAGPPETRADRSTPNALS